MNSYLLAFLGGFVYGMLTIMIFLSFFFFLVQHVALKANMNQEGDNSIGGSARKIKSKKQQEKQTKNPSP